MVCVPCVLIVSALKLLTVSRAGGQCLLAGPEVDVWGQVPSPRGSDGQPKPPPGAGPGAAGCPSRQGTQKDLRGAQALCPVRLL